MTKSNKNLTSAKQNKQDEFYTQIDDIKAELPHYKDHFKGKVVLLNCDDPKVSKFFEYFYFNFEKLGLKGLMTTCYNADGKGRYCIYNGDKLNVVNMKGDGDFRSEEAIEFLKHADIVVGNPPFSLFREYVAQLVEYDKKFLILGSMNSITHQGIYPLIKANKAWVGYNYGGLTFAMPDHYDMGKSGYIKDGVKYKKVLVLWYTNLEHDKQNEFIPLTESYTPKAYPKYDNYIDIIEVSKVKNIPKDWDGIMGVPISFMNRYNSQQFEIVGCSYSYGEPVGSHRDGQGFGCSVDGKEIYKRFFIKRVV